MITAVAYAMRIIRVIISTKFVKLPKMRKCRTADCLGYPQYHRCMCVGTQLHNALLDVGVTR